MQAFVLLAAAYIPFFFVRNIRIKTAGMIVLDVIIYLIITFSGFGQARALAFLTAAFFMSVFTVFAEEKEAGNKKNNMAAAVILLLITASACGYTLFSGTAPVPQYTINPWMPAFIFAAASAACYFILSGKNINE